MKLQSAGDLGLGADVLGIVAAHQALQLRELADHSGDEIGFRKSCGAARVFRNGVASAREFERERLDAVDAILLTAELFMERDAGKLACHLAERMLEILLPEELGVGEPRADDLFVARDDFCATVFRDEIGNEQELVRELLGARLTQREALLMRLHRRRQDLGGHFEEGLIERAHEHDGPFRQTSVLGEQRVVLDQLELGVLGERVRLLGNGGGALRGIEHHMMRGELRFIIREILDLERAGSEETMTARLVARFDPCDLERHDLAVEKAQHRLQRAHPLER